MGDEQTGNNASPQSEPHVLPLWSRYVARIKCYFHKRSAKREKETPQDRFARRTANATVAIAFLAVVAAGVGVLQYFTMQGQLTAIEADQRPWVFATNIVASKPISRDSRGLGITLQFFLQNGGHSPALQTAIHFNVFSLVKTIHYRDEEQIACEKARAPGIGNILFQGTSASQEYFSILPNTEIEAALALHPKVWLPYVVACVAYRSPRTGVAHSTKYELIVEPNFTTKKWPCCVFPVNETVEPADLHVVLYPVNTAD